MNVGNREFGMVEVGLWGGGVGEGVHAKARVCEGRVRREAGRRTPCAGRAVILTAVQSLRLLVRRAACSEWAACGERGLLTCGCGAVSC